MYRFTCTVGVVLLTGACTPPSKSLGAGQSDSSSGSSDPISESSATDDANGSTAASTDGNGDCEAICCESVENPAAICAAAQTQQDCEGAQVGDDWCFWVEWRPTTFDGIACELGPPQFECRHQTCQEEGCAGPFFCPGGGTGVVVRGGPEGTEIGLGNWCFPPDGATQCQWDSQELFVSGPPECVCGCEGSNLCDAPFSAYLAELASGSKSGAMDCGALEGDASVPNWQASHDCVLAAATAGETFILSWGENEGDIEMDVQVRNGLVGLQGESYGILGVHSDTTDTEQFIQQGTCSALTAQEDCTVDVGRLCITCVDPGQPEQVCP